MFLIFIVTLIVTFIFILAYWILFSKAIEWGKKSVFGQCILLLTAFLSLYGLVILTFLANIFLVVKIDFWLLTTTLKWIAITLLSFYLIGSIIEGFKEFKRSKAECYWKRIVSGIGMAVGNFLACIYVLGETSIYLIPVWALILLLKYFFHHYDFI